MIQCKVFAGIVSFELPPHKNVPQPSRFRIQTGLLKSVNGIPDQTLQPFNVSLPFGNRRIMARPLPDDRPSCAIFIQNRDYVLVS